LARQLVRRDPSLWLSTSWTTRPRRDGEAEGDYVFVDRAAFEARATAGGFLEWAEFLGNLYGTPMPDPPPGCDVLLEIDVEGARQVVARVPDAHVVLVVAPSEDDQVERLRGRGDDEPHVAARVTRGRAEVAEAKALTDDVIVNADVESAIAQLLSILARLRATATTKDDPT
jgi:guanylate kinase